MRYRVTIPTLYPSTSAGHLDPSARVGHYATASTVLKAARIIRGRLADSQRRVVSVLTVEPVGEGYPVTVTLDYSHPGDLLCSRQGVR